MVERLKIEATELTPPHQDSKKQYCVVGRISKIRAQSNINVVNLRFWGYVNEIFRTGKCENTHFPDKVH